MIDFKIYKCLVYCGDNKCDCEFKRILQNRESLLDEIKRDWVNNPPPPKQQKEAQE